MRDFHLPADTDPKVVELMSEMNERSAGHNCGTVALAALYLAASAICTEAYGNGRSMEDVLDEDVAAFADSLRASVMSNMKRWREML